MLDEDLAAVVLSYELAQRNRIATAAHLRASGAGGGCEPSLAANGVADMLALLEWERRAEEGLRRQMASAVERHPTWPWLEQVRGIGPTLAARLLARLRIERAPTPSSFWSYCGLSTVAATRYRCITCGVVLDFATGSTAPRRHHAAHGGECEGTLAADASCGARVAVRFPGRGRARTFDVSARSLCHIIGVSFLRRGRSYRRVYDDRRERLRVDRPGWSPNRVHLSAMRAMEKLFLAHLWLVWADARGVGRRAPYVMHHRGTVASFISPWEMVDA